MPYDPNALPYIINTKELPANQAAAAMVQTKIVSTSLWCQSPYYTPYWGNTLGTPNSPAWTPTSPIVCTASVGWPDATVVDRDLAANVALNAEKTKQTTNQTNATNAINAITGITGGAPSVGTVTPNTAPHNAATALTIQGGGFSVSAPTVTVGGVACTGVTVVNDGELTCTTGTTMAAGPADVRVTTTAGSGTMVGGMTLT